MSPRKRPPNRRLNSLFDFECNDLRYTAACEVLENIRAFDRRDALALADEIVDATITVLQGDHNISSRSFAEWSLMLANLRARVAERIADEIEGCVDLQTVVLELKAAEWPDALERLNPDGQISAIGCERPLELGIDVETRSTIDLQEVGVHRYATDPTTAMRCAALTTADAPPELWTPDKPCPEIVKRAVAEGWIIHAFHANFERTIWRHILAPRHGWPEPGLEVWRCSMAMALALSLPGKLENVARALELQHQKDAAGHRLMLMMAKPRKAHKDEDPKGTYWFDDQARLDRLYAYCKQDGEVQRELFTRLPPLSPPEPALWRLDAIINERGFRIDRPLAEAARKIAQQAVPEIDAELAALTEGAVTTVNQVAKLQEWLAQNCCIVKDLQKKTVADLLVDELPAKARRALELRQDGGQAAVKKIRTLLQRAGTDDRVRDAFQFHKASTGRWAGEGFQPQNLKRPQEEDLEAAIAAVNTGSYEHVRSLYPQALSLLGDLGRGLITAAPGHTLIGADFSSVESRCLAWLSDEKWKVDSYARYDATHEPRDEPYCILACRMLHKPDGTFTPESPERKIGKTADLACGYMGGADAIEKFAPGMFDAVQREQIKNEWRAAHPHVVEYWYALDRAAWAAVKERGRVVQCGPIAFRCSGAFLFLKLPSGRKLAYPIARNKLIDPRRGTVLFADNAAGRWRNCRDGRGAYGGVWTENIVQAIARDLLTGAMLRIEMAGYPVVLHVHDEVVAEVPDGFGSTEEFTHLMTSKPAWALTLPIAASAWTGLRFS